jgi:methylphosphotriester-DNA--protein-cysteine methyltransferase
MPSAPGESPYTEVAPPADLAVYVDRLWMRTCRAELAGRIHRVLPDGCVDVIVDPGKRTAELVGTMTRAIEIAEQPGEIVAVRFKPGTAAALTGFALAEITDRNLDLAELGTPGALAERIAEATAVTAAPLPAKIPLAAVAHARLAALVAWLRARLADAARPDPLVARAVALLSTGDTRVDGVAASLGVTRQHLARGFRREVGITPKQLARIARMQRAATLLRRGGDLARLARLATELGYFDQSHLTHDLRDLAGLTPAAVAAERPISLAHLFGAAPVLER